MATYGDEVAYYESKADEIRRGQLKAVQESAARWSALVTALLGLFTAVAFAGGLSTIDRLSPPLDVIIRVITSVALFSAVVATFLFARARGGLELKRLGWLTGKMLMDREPRLIDAALRNLHWGQRSALLTVALVLGGSAVVLWAPTASPSATPVLARFSDAAVCGRPTVVGGELRVSGRPLREAVEILTVTTCPSPKR